MKHELFTNELNTFANEDIKEFAKILLDDAPDYFYKVAASSTGKYHPAYALGNGGLMRHTKSVVRFYNHLMSIEQNKCMFTDREIDLGRVACLIHDIQKSGTEESYIEKSNNGQNKVFTVFDHPLLAAKYVMSYKDKHLSENELKFVAMGVGSHMGEFNTDKRNPNVTLPKPKTEMQQIIHLADYLASRKDIDVSFEDDKNAYPIAKAEEYRLNFGKHNGKLLTEVPKDYLKWLLGNDLKEPLRTLVIEVLKGGE